MPRTVRDTGLENRTARSRLKRETNHTTALEPGLILNTQAASGPGAGLRDTTWETIL